MGFAQDNDRTSFKQLLGVPDVQFTVPFYQRPYAWETEQIEELWSDLQKAVGSTHFMGSLVLNFEKESQPQIIDGQQRIATIFMLLSAIRDLYAEMKKDLVGRIQVYMQNQWADESLRFKFRPGNANWEVFRDYILRIPDDPQRKNWADFDDLPKDIRIRNRNIKRNALKIQELLNAELTKREGPGKLKFLEDLEKTVVAGLQFIPIKVSSVEDAFIIFETLNDRGLELSAGDLVKNLILAEAARQALPVEVLADDWDEVVDSLNGADITRFLRHYLLAKHHPITKKDVFPKFKEELKSLGPEQLMTRLRLASRTYGCFVQPPADWPQDVINSLDGLSWLHAVICYSALLPAKTYLNDQDFVTYLRAAEILTFRYSSVCSKGSNDLELVYHKSAKLLEESKGKEFQKALEILVQASPSPEEFEAAFLKQSMGQKDTVSYMLREIERSRDSEEKLPGPPRNLHIEHILPQEPDSDWAASLSGYTEEAIEDFKSRWGNLTLLGGRKNKKISNQGFEKKKKTYSESNILITRALASLSEWNPTAIETRQKEMAATAEKLWSMKSIESALAASAS